MRLILLLVFSAVLAGCNGIERPDSNVGVVNVAGLELDVLNVKNDFDDAGHVLPKHDPVVVKFKDEHEMLETLNKGAWLDPKSLANFKAFMMNYRDALTSCQTQRTGD